LFFVLSKWLAIFTRPFTYVVLLGLWALLSHKRSRKRKLITISGILLLVFSNPLLINKVFRWYEGQPTEMSTLIPPYDCGILLTGVVDIYREPADRVYFMKGADRATHSLQLYQEGIISRILITGENARIISDGTSEAEILKKFFLSNGVPERDLLIEARAKNTRQNALYSAQLLDSLGFNKEKILLITSGFHMKRSEACFRKVGLPCTPFRVDFFAPQTTRWTVEEIIWPSADALVKWNILTKEWVGLLSYKMAGYI
jgi:uncharacterized SAM-binding protein YcdF (DUF218 family)